MLDDALKNTFPASDPVSIVISEEKRMRPESASGTHRPGSYAGRSTLGHRSADRDKEKPRLGSRGFLRRTEGTGAGGLRDLPYTVSTPIAPIQFPHGTDVGAPARMLAESAVKCNLITEMSGILPK